MTHQTASWKNTQLLGDHVIEMWNFGGERTKWSNHAIFSGPDGGSLV